MDLVQGAVAFKQAEMASKVQYAVAAKMMNNARQNGAAIVQLIDAANISANKAGDAMVAAATGLGGSLDTFA